MFVATKIPYVGQAIMGLQKVADGAGMADDFWNWFVDLFTDDEKYKIDIDVDYHLDLVATGNFKIEAEAVTYHTIDGWRTGEIKPLAEFQFGIEAGVKISARVGKFEGSAEVFGKGYGKWVVQKGTNEEGEKVWQIEYQGLYAVFYANVSSSNENTNGAGSLPDEKGKPTEKFLIHKGFTYETKKN